LRSASLQKIDISWLSYSYSAVWGISKLLVVLLPVTIQKNFTEA